MVSTDFFNTFTPVCSHRYYLFHTCILSCSRLRMHTYVCTRSHLSNTRLFTPTSTPIHTYSFPTSSRHLRALLSVCGGCSFGGLGCCSCRVCVGGNVLCRCACVCDLLIFLHLSNIRLFTPTSTPNHTYSFTLVRCVCGGVSFGALGCLCVSVSGVLFSLSVCVCATC